MWTEYTSHSFLKSPGPSQENGADFTSLGTPGPITGKFMVGAVGDFTLQSMGRTKHKFPDYGGPGIRSEVIRLKSTAVVHVGLQVHT